MSYDPFDDAMTDEPSVWFGRVDVEAFVGFFQTGVGATPYDENVHGPDQKHYLIIHFEFIPLDVTHKTFSRHLGKWTEEFKTVLRPSLLALTDQIASIKGLVPGQFNPMRAVSGMYAKCLRVRNPDNEEGETWTTMKFEEIYHDGIACADAWEAHSGKELGGSPVADMAFLPGPTPAANMPVDPARASMAAFLSALWAQSGQDMIKMQGLLDANPMIGAHFTVESPEVIEVMSD